MIRRYSELKSLKTYDERLTYLLLDGRVGRETFGALREYNQDFYRSRQWRSVRNHVMLRDGGCDLGIRGEEISGMIIVHHMNPITPETLANHIELALDPEFLITVSPRTHNSIHYGAKFEIVNHPPERFPGDTNLW